MKMPSDSIMKSGQTCSKANQFRISHSTKLSNCTIARTRQSRDDSLQLILYSSAGRDCGGAVTIFCAVPMLTLKIFCQSNSMAGNWSNSKNFPEEDFVCAPTKSNLKSLKHSSKAKRENFQTRLLKKNALNQTHNHNFFEKSYSFGEFITFFPRD